MTLLRTQIKLLLNRQQLAVLATATADQPYTSLVAFASTDDLKRLAFATLTGTKKYANLLANPKISLLIDSRVNESSDFNQAEAVTALGVIAWELANSVQFKKLYLAKHPYLEDFIAHPDCSLLVVSVERYYYVSKFQQVETLDFSS